MRHVSWLRLCAAAALLVVGCASRAATCEDLTKLQLARGALSCVESIPAGSLQLPAAGPAPAQKATVRAFCRAYLTLTPSPDSDIKVEVWLPAENWNGKLLSVGNGGWSGAIYYGAMIEPLERGYA